MTNTDIPTCAPTADDYIVIFWDTTDHWQWTPTHIGIHEPVKSIQDRMAAYAGDNPHIIYMVVLKTDYYESLRQGFGNGKVGA